MKPFLRAGVLENFRATAQSLGADPDQLLRQADKAMYEAKQRGRNQYAEVFDTPNAA